MDIERTIDGRVVFDPCLNCEGYGTVYEDEEATVEGPCPACGGSGETPTTPDFPPDGALNGIL